jgi:hypothetical protein
VLGRSWLGADVVRGPVIYLGVEDDMDEMHRRFDAIAREQQVDLDRLEGLHICCVAVRLTAVKFYEKLGFVRAGKTDPRCGFTQATITDPQERLRNLPRDPTRHLSGRRAARLKVHSRCCRTIPSVRTSPCPSTAVLPSSRR